VRFCSVDQPDRGERLLKSGSKVIGDTSAEATQGPRGVKRQRRVEAT
jgi:hypothetical protein